MVQDQLIARGITDTRVLEVMRLVPRHLFVPIEHRPNAYSDSPLPIGAGQTISQPFMVALMSQLLALHGHERVLEIGTGCGYQTAILCYLAKFVYSLERFPQLSALAQTHLTDLHLSNLHLIVADGSYGLAEHSPFEAILVTAVAPKVPPPFLAQLTRNGGRLVIPVGRGESQHLLVITRHGDRYDQQSITPVRFVPLIGRYGFTPPEA